MNFTKTVNHYEAKIRQSSDTYTNESNSAKGISFLVDVETAEALTMNLHIDKVVNEKLKNEKFY